MKKDKLEVEDYPRVHLFYTEYLAKGYPITQIAKLYNQIHETNHAESTLRNRYEHIEKGILSTIQAEEILKREKQAERKMVQADIRFREAQNHLKYTRALAREIGDYTTVRNIIVEEMLTDYEPVTGTVEFKPSLDKRTKSTAFVLSDAHAGYKYENHYNEDIFKRRMNKAFEAIYNQVLEEELKEIHIFELGDQIEGTSLRKGQLTQITTLMAGQVNLYLESFLENLKTLSDNLPNTKINLVIITRDNHSEVRVHGTQRNELDDSMAEVIGARVLSEVDTAQRYGGMKNIEVITGPDLLVKMPNDKKVHLSHGHMYSRDISKIHKQVYDTKGEDPDVVIVGHWHNFQSLGRNVIGGFQRKTITAPSIVGDTNYSLEQLHLSSLPGILRVDIYDTHSDEKFIPLVLDKD